MRILLLSQWYPPEPMKLLSDMAETLKEFGHDVTVLTGFPNWPSGRIYPGYAIRIRQKEFQSGVPVIRVPIYPDHSRSKQKRILNLLSFVVSSSAFGPLFCKRPDIIHAIQPPTTCLAAWHLGRIWNVPFTYEVQDMWPETLQATNMITNVNSLSTVGKYCEWVYGKAAAIRVISPGFGENLVSKGVPACKVHFIPNWVDADFYTPDISFNALAGEISVPQAFKIVYAGTIGLAQGLETVLDAASLLTDLPDICFLLAGDGLELPRLRESASQRGLKNVRFLGRLPMEKMPQLYALSDGLLVHLKDNPLFRITIPHKTLTYLAAGKPVIAAVEGDVSNLIEAAGAGLTCRSGDPVALADAVRKLYSLPADERNQLGTQGRRVSVERYGRRQLVAQIAEMFESVTKIEP